VCVFAPGEVRAALKKDFPPWKKRKSRARH
jgi:hypothetical protein